MCSVSLCLCMRTYGKVIRGKAQVCTLKRNYCCHSVTLQGHPNRMQNVTCLTCAFPIWQCGLKNKNHHMTCVSSTVSVTLLYKKKKTIDFYAWFHSATLKSKVWIVPCIDANLRENTVQRVKGQNWPFNKTGKKIEKYKFQFNFSSM